MSKQNVTRPLFRYQTCGLVVLSCIALPHLSQMHQDQQPDVVIVEDTLPQKLEQVHSMGETWQVSSTQVMLNLPGLLHILVDGAERLVFMRCAELSDEAVAAMLFGSAWLILLMRRDQFPIRASAVLRDDKALLFCGRSLAGKSTIAAVMHQAGYPMIGDDLSLLTLDHQGRLLVLPDGARPRLWPDAIAGLELSAFVGELVRPDLTKRMLHLPPSLHAKNAPIPVGAIFVLEQQRFGEPPHLAEISLIDRIQFMRALTPRPEMIEPLRKVASYLEFSARAARSVVWRRLRIAPNLGRDAGTMLSQSLDMMAYKP